MVYGGRFFLHLASVELRHAAGDDQRLTLAFVGGEFAHSLHRLFLALFDEAASVDDDRIGFGGVDHGQQFPPGQQPFEVLAVHVVLWAPECNEVVGLRYGHQGPSLMTMMTALPAGQAASAPGDWSMTLPFASLLF